MTAAIAGFVQGLFQGADWREDREDRVRKRNLEDEALAQDRERFTWEREDQEHERQTRKQAAEDAAELRSAFAEFSTPATTAAQPAQPKQAEQTPATVLVPAQAVPFASPTPAERTKLGFGIVGDVVRGSAGQGSVAGDPAADRLGMPQKSGGAVLPDARPAQAMSAGPAFEQTGRNPAVSPGISIMDLGIQASQKNAAAQAAAAGPDFEQSGRRDRTAGERRAQGVWDAVKETAGSVAGAAKDTFVGGLNTYGAAVGAPASSTVKEIGGLAASAVGATGAGAAAMDSADQDRKRAQDWLKARRVQGAAPAPAASPAAAATGGQKPETVASPAPVPQAGADRLAFSQVPKTQEGTPMVSLSMGRELGVLGKDGVIKSTKAQTEKASAAFGKAYNTKAVPKVVNAYLKQGKIQEAKLFQEFVQDQSVQAGMALWAKSLHLFNRGDIKGSLKALIDAENARGYDDNGFVVDEARSQFAYAPNGDPIGAQLVFVNESTGEEFVQNVESVDDFLIAGLGLLPPEKVFERSFEYAKSFREKAELDPEAVMKVVEERALNDQEGFGKLPKSEQIAQVTREFSSIAGQASGARAIDPGQIMD